MSSHIRLDECPHCGTRAVSAHAKAEAQYGSGHWTLYGCNHCEGLTLMERTASGIQPMYPAGRHELPSDTEIAAEIRDEFREAGVCLDMGCNKASMVMSRRVLQRVLKEQGCAQRNLVDQINHAISNGILRRAFHGAAEEVRLYGNLGAHPDDDQLENCTRQNASMILEFVRLLIEEFYELPTRVSALKSKRIAARGTT